MSIVDMDTERRRYEEVLAAVKVSRRERIATAVLAGLTTATQPDGTWAHTPGIAASTAVEYADALIAALDASVAIPPPAPELPSVDEAGSARMDALAAAKLREIVGGHPRTVVTPATPGSAPIPATCGKPIGEALVCALDANHAPPCLAAKPGRNECGKPVDDGFPCAFTPGHAGECDSIPF